MLFSEYFNWKRKYAPSHYCDLCFPPEAQQVEKLVGAYDVIMKEKDSFTKECKEKVKDFRYHYLNYCCK